MASCSEAAAAAPITAVSAPRPPRCERGGHRPLTAGAAPGGTHVLYPHGAAPHRGLPAAPLSPLPERRRRRSRSPPPSPPQSAGSERPPTPHARSLPARLRAPSPRSSLPSPPPPGSNYLIVRCRDARRPRAEPPPSAPRRPPQRPAQRAQPPRHHRAAPPRAVRCSRAPPSPRPQPRPAPPPSLERAKRRHVGAGDVTERGGGTAPPSSGPTRGAESIAPPLPPSLHLPIPARRRPAAPSPRAERSGAEPRVPPPPPPSPARAARTRRGKEAALWLRPVFLFSSSAAYCLQPTSFVQGKKNKQTHTQKVPSVSRRYFTALHRVSFTL